MCVGGGEREDSQVAVHQTLRGAHCRDQEASRRGKAIAKLQNFTLKGQCHEIFECWFFHHIAPLGPISSMLGRFQVLPNILGDIQ